MTNGEKMLVSIAIEAAKSCLHVFKNEYPADDRPRKALEAAERWLHEPTIENRRLLESWRRKFGDQRSGMGKLDLPRKRVDAQPELPDIPLPRQWMQFGVRVTPTESTAESTVGNGFTQSCAKM